MLHRLLLTFFAAMALHQASAFVSIAGKNVATTTMTETRMEMTPVDRRGFFANAVTAAAILSTAAPAFALNNFPADNEIVKEQRTQTGKLDINNAPVADYMQYPGLYPTIGGKIANNGPFKSVKDVYKLSVLTSSEKSKLKEYETALTATPATGLDVMRGRDPYRSSFNQFTSLQSE